MKFELFRAAAIAVAAVALGAILSCALPFAALAAVAARSLSARVAYGTVATVVLFDQLYGFTVRHYPLHAATISWGVVFAIASLAAVAVARAVPASRSAMFAALALAFVADQGVITAYSAVMHEMESNTWAIVGQVALANVAGLALLWPVAHAVTLAERGARPAEN